jgi:hypothetical protein
LYSAVRKEPRCNRPVGEGANRTLTHFSQIEFDTWNCLDKIHFRKYLQKFGLIFMDSAIFPEVVQFTILKIYQRTTLTKDNIRSQRPQDGTCAKF